MINSFTQLAFYLSLKSSPKVLVLASETVQVKNLLLSIQEGGEVMDLQKTFFLP